jgi:hypothetical protein
MTSDITCMKCGRDLTWRAHFYTYMGDNQFGPRCYGGGCHGGNQSSVGIETTPPETPFEKGLGEVLSEVRELMCDRHTKYGPGNISKRGIPGVLVRLDDKLARIDNGDMDFADESYRDAWLDVVGYGLIALMCLDGNWPGVAKP